MAATQRGVGAGTGWALLSAASFGSSGTFGGSLIAAGWTPALVVLIRIALGAALLAIPTAIALRGRWSMVWAARKITLLYGVFAVACAQVFYFNAVQRLSVGVALMLEYLGVILVVGWMWARHSRTPQRMTIVGSLLALIGLALVLDLLGSAHLDLIGVLWGLAAAVGLAVFFVVSAREQDALPPVATAGVGMGVGAVVLLIFGGIGVLPFGTGSSTVVLGGMRLPWFVPIAGLGVIAAALAYAVGVTAARLLGATLASFIGLTEVLFAVLFAWLLLDQLPGTIQIAGGALIIGGVCLVRIDELRRDRRAVSAAGVSAFAD